MFVTHNVFQAFSVSTVPLVPTSRNYDIPTSLVDLIGYLDPDKMMMMGNHSVLFPILSPTETQQKLQLDAKDRQSPTGTTRYTSYSNTDERPSPSPPQTSCVGLRSVFVLLLERER